MTKTVGHGQMKPATLLVISRLCCQISVPVTNVQGIWYEFIEKKRFFWLTGLVVLVHDVWLTDKAQVGSWA